MNDKDRLLTRWREYFSDRQGDLAERQWMFEEKINDIEGLVTRGSASLLTDSEVNAISLRFGFLATWYGREAIVGVLGRSNHGWADLQLSLLFRYWRARTTRALAPSAGPAFDLAEPALALSHALATGVDDVAKWLGGFLVGLEGDENHADWVSDRIENFVHWLFCRWGGVKFAIEKSLGVYQSICDEWTSGSDRLKDAIARTCDWRMAHTMEEDPDDNKVEWGYGYPPYSLFPAEILAIERVRRELRLDFVRPKHPLLETPLANPPYPLPMPRDQLLERALATIRKKYPNV